MKKTMKTASKTKYQLTYAYMDEFGEGYYETSGGCLFGTEFGGDVADTLFDSEEDALDAFLSCLMDPHGLAGRHGWDWTSEDVTESEDFRGWGIVVRQSVMSEEGKDSNLYSVTIDEADCGKVVLALPPKKARRCR